ncbi:MAG: hypothetical protein D6812_07355 [Deltaproteobacteria bacterium]|nr:MAG: hypothetical protein D6812_07355 [Deltaproteobacteria bacterium]RME52511.1 MAG: hypothetical protein D6795_06655 [Deltaproteobacteria bacterium]
MNVDRCPQCGEAIDTTLLYPRAFICRWCGWRTEDEAFLQALREKFDAEDFTPPLGFSSELGRGMRTWNDFAMAVTRTYILGRSVLRQWTWRHYLWYSVGVVVVVTLFVLFFS